MTTKSKNNWLTNLNKKDIWKFTQDTAFVGILWVFAQALNYFFNILVARDLSEEDFGVYGSLLGFVYIFSVIGETLSTYVTKTVAKDTRLNYTYFRHNLVSKVIPFLVIAVALLFGLSPLISNLLRIDIFSFNTILAVLVGFVFWGITRGLFLGRQMIITAYGLIVLEAIIKYAIGYFGILKYGNQYPALLAYGLPGLAVSLMTYWFIAKQDLKYKKEAKIKLSFKEPLLIMLNLVLFNWIFAFDIAYLPTDIRADYSAISILGKVVFFAASMSVPLMFAKISNAKKESKKKLFIGMSYAIGVAAGLTLTGIYYFFGTDLIEIIYAGKYMGIVEFLPLYSLGAMTFALGLANLNYKISQGKYKSWILLLPVAVIQAVVLTTCKPDLELAITIQTIILLFTGVLLIISKLDSD